MFISFAAPLRSCSRLYIIAVYSGSPRGAHNSMSLGGCRSSIHCNVIHLITFFLNPKMSFKDSNVHMFWLHLWNFAFTWVEGLSTFQSVHFSYLSCRRWLLTGENTFHQGECNSGGTIKCPSICSFYLVFHHCFCPNPFYVSEGLSFNLGQWCWLWRTSVLSCASTAADVLDGCRNSIMIVRQHQNKFISFTHIV